MRQIQILREYDPKRGDQVTTLSWEYPSGHEVPQHAHGADQLIYAVSGVMEVASGQNVWLIPPQFGLWIPARTRHRILMLSAVSMRTLYFRPALKTLPRGLCTVLYVGLLLRELILEAVSVGRLRAKNGYERALREVLMVHLKRATPMPTFIRMPEDARALLVARGAMKNAGRSRSLAMLSKEAGASVRTIQRIFRRETGSDFESWRRQMRLTRAVELLVAGRSVKEVSFGVGYRQASAFVESFRRTFGSTPRAWVRELGKRTHG